MFDNLVSYVEEEEQKIKDSQKEIISNKKLISKLKARIDLASTAQAKLQKLDMKKDLKDGIDLYKRASEKSGFRNLVDDIENIEKVFNSHQL